MLSLGLEILPPSQLEHFEQSNVRLLHIPPNHVAPIEGQKRWTSHPLLTPSLRINNWSALFRKTVTNPIPVNLTICSDKYDLTSIQKIFKGLSTSDINFTLTSTQLSIVATGPFRVTLNTMLQKIFLLSSHIINGDKSMNIPIQIGLAVFENKALWLHCDLIDGRSIANDSFQVLKMLENQDELVDYRYLEYHPLKNIGTNINEIKLKVTSPFSSTPIKCLQDGCILFQLVFRPPN